MNQPLGYSLDDALENLRDYFVRRYETRRSRAGRPAGEEPAAKAAPAAATAPGPSPAANQAPTMSPIEGMRIKCYLQTEHGYIPVMEKIEGASTAAPPPPPSSPPPATPPPVPPPASAAAPPESDRATLTALRQVSEHLEGLTERIDLGLQLVLSKLSPADASRPAAPAPAPSSASVAAPSTAAPPPSDKTTDPSSTDLTERIAGLFADMGQQHHEAMLATLRAEREFIGTQIGRVLADERKAQREQVESSMAAMMAEHRKEIAAEADRAYTAHREQLADLVRELQREHDERLAAQEKKSAETLARVHQEHREQLAAQQQTFVDTLTRVHEEHALGLKAAVDSALAGQAKVLEGVVDKVATSLAEKFEGGLVDLTPLHDGMSELHDAIQGSSSAISSRLNGLITTVRDELRSASKSRLAPAAQTPVPPSVLSPVGESPPPPLSMTSTSPCAEEASHG